MAKQREVEREIAYALVTPLWQRIAWMSAVDVLVTRDSDVTTEVLDEHLACAGVKRDDWARLEFLRGALTPAHRPQLVEALEHTQRAGVVELLAWTCATSKEFASALRRGDADKSLQPAIDYGLRRFVKEPAVAKKLWSRAKPFAKTAARGKWQMQGAHAWEALFVTDIRESADAVTQMIASTWIYTNLAAKELLCSAAAKRARLLKHGKHCLAPLVEAVQESYTDEEITHSAVVLGGAAVKRHLEEKWEQFSRYQLDNHPARTTIGGLLALAPTSKAYQDAARKMLPKMLKDDLIGSDDIGRINGIVMGIARGRVRALHPLLEKVAKWKYKMPGFDTQSAARASLAAELVRRRARRTLDER